MSHAEKQLVALAFVARSVLEGEIGLGADCCVAATRAGLDVLEAWGIKARPLLCEAAACNAAYRSGNRDPERAYVVQIDSGIETKPAEREMREHPDDRQGLHGHLVIAANLPKGRHALLDLTAFQFDRPTRHISVPTGLVASTRGPIVPGTKWTVYADLPQLAMLMWREHPNASDARARYETCGDWKHPTPFHRECHARTVGLLKSRAEQAMRTHIVKVIDP